MSKANITILELPFKVNAAIILRETQTKPIRSYARPSKYGGTGTLSLPKGTSGFIIATYDAGEIYKASPDIYLAMLKQLTKKWNINIFCYDLYLEIIGQNLNYGEAQTIYLTVMFYQQLRMLIPFYEDDIVSDIVTFF